MTYAIANIVYGINLTEPWDNDPYKAIRSEINNLFDEDEIKGFESAYSGSSTPPQWYGITLDYEISECDDDTDCEELRSHLEVTPKLREDFQSLLQETLADDSIPAAVKEVLETVKPKMLLLWGTS